MTEPSRKPPAPIPVDPAHLQPRLVAILTAAATAALRQPVRVMALSPVLESLRRTGDWTAQGRRHLLQSHRPRPRPSRWGRPSAR